MLTITVLAENSDGKGLCGEHGLSLHIEYEGRRYLLDAGATGLFAENAAKLGLSLTEVEAVFLSLRPCRRASPFFRRECSCKGLSAGSGSRKLLLGEGGSTGIHRDPKRAFAGARR